MNLMEVTNTLLQRALDEGLTLGEISRRSNGIVDKEWLKKYAARRDDDSADATVRRVQGLHDSLIEMGFAVPARKKKLA